MCRACAADEAGSHGPTADRCQRATPTGIDAGVEIGQRALATCCRHRTQTQERSTDVMGMPSRRRRSVLSTLALPGLGARRRRGAQPLRRKNVEHACAWTPRCLESRARARRKGFPGRSLQAHPFALRGGPRRPPARRESRYLRAPDRTRSLPRCMIHARLRIRAARAVWRGRFTSPAGGTARKRAASSSSHSRKAMKPACLRERSGYTR